MFLKYIVFFFWKKKYIVVDIISCFYIAQRWALSEFLTWIKFSLVTVVLG